MENESEYPWKKLSYCYSFLHLLYSLQYILWMLWSSACFRWPVLRNSTWMHHSLTDTEKQLGLGSFFFFFFSSFLVRWHHVIKSSSVLKNKDTGNHIFTSNCTGPTKNKSSSDSLIVKTLASPTYSIILYSLNEIISQLVNWIQLYFIGWVCCILSKLIG